MMLVFLIITEVQCQKNTEQFLSYKPVTHKTRLRGSEASLNNLELKPLSQSVTMVLLIGRGQRFAPALDHTY